MVKKLLLLFLMSSHLSASWRFEDTGGYIILLSFVSGAINIAIRDFQAKIEKEQNKPDEENFDNKQEQSVEDCEKTIKNLEKTRMVIIGSLITLCLPGLYCILDDVYHHFMPTEEQKIANQKAEEYLQASTAQVNFSNCLFSSDYDSLRSDFFNCPEKCKELARIFVESRHEYGKNEAIKMIQDFDEYWKKTC
jgi:hypothetical protein